MSIFEHLEELRSILIKIIIILGCSFFITYSYSDLITAFLLKPLRQALLTEGGKVIYLGVLDKILTKFQVAFWTSIIISSPLWFYQIWKFIKPGLYQHEIKTVRPFIIIGFLLFITGIMFGYHIIFPFTFKALMNFGVDHVQANINLKDHLILTSKILVFLGIIFQVPNVLLILGFMGVVTKYSLQKIRRYVYLALAVISALITPPDVMTLLGLFIPLIILYEIGILGVKLFVHPYLKRHHRSFSTSHKS